MKHSIPRLISRLAVLSVLLAHVPIYAQSWYALGSGTTGYYVLALTNYSGSLIAGGSFNTAGGSGANNIARWNGSSWDSLGSGVSGGYVYPHSLKVYGNDLVAGGSFTSAGGLSASKIAKWDGNSWSPLGSGVDSQVEAMAVYGNELIVGGFFNNAGGAGASRIASWNGNSWNALGSGISGYAVYSLSTYGNDLIAGGRFTTAGGNSANNIAKWNGTSWSPLGGGLLGSLAFGLTEVIALTVYNGKLIAGGNFTTAGGKTVNGIASWDGSTWDSLGSGMNAQVFALTVHGNDLYAGGWFTTAGGTNANYIAKWDGSAWTPLGSGTGERVVDLTVYGGDVIAGGWFTTAGGNSANHIAGWQNLVPVELTSFSARQSSGGISLNWSTERESNCLGFNVERNLHGAWSAVGFVPGHGTTHDRHEYTFWDPAAPVGQQILYRLKQDDFDGTFTYSPTTEIFVSPSEQTPHLNPNFPNPFSSSTSLSFRVPEPSDVVLSIRSILGEDVAVLVDTRMDAGYASVSWNGKGKNGTPLPAGVYIAHFRSVPQNSGQVFTDAKLMVRSQ